MKFIRRWSPHGYDRAVALFERGFYDSSHFFRVIPGFLAQFGISYTEDEELMQFAEAPIRDDPQLDPPIPFETGTISHAGSGPNSRDTHLFIAYEPYEMFGTELWETPIGKVISGMDTVNNLYGEYGDEPPDGDGPSQQDIYSKGRKYIEAQFPNLDSFLTCTVNRQNDGDDTGVGNKEPMGEDFEEVIDGFEGTAEENYKEGDDGAEEENYEEPDEEAEEENFEEGDDEIEEVEEIDDYQELDNATTESPIGDDEEQPPLRLRNEKEPGDMLSQSMKRELSEKPQAGARTHYNNYYLFVVVLLIALCIIRRGNKKDIRKMN
eukprot:CAMPEP_0172510784 /NCGR_PEP_ID=MMETSP1066-20121228/231300_1 /TAXON_ID=671091 /ORGANISM="Coscinodiscus wailesii, Strain CCMP2513" /LENGTH=321 /DNA_ID=CAMNT_0013289909 /DNA_START=235 /DNA_END=1200 /DNA_ORIENTATION=+